MENPADLGVDDKVVDWMVSAATMGDGFMVVVDCCKAASAAAK